MIFLDLKAGTVPVHAYRYTVCTVLNCMYIAMCSLLRTVPFHHNLKRVRFPGTYAGLQLEEWQAVNNNSSSLSPGASGAASMSCGGSGAGAS